MAAQRDWRWWDKKDDAHEHVSHVLNSIASDASVRRADDEHHLRLYSDSEWRATYGSDRRISDPKRNGRAKRKQLSLNVVRNMVNSAVSMICRSRPYVSFMTDGGDWKLHLAARKRERFVQAHLLRERAHILAQRVVKNACIFGLGAVRIVRDGKKIRYEVVNPGELFVDEQEANRGGVRSFYHVRLVDRAVLAELFPKHKKQIEKAGGVQSYWQSASSNQVVLIDAWHLPSAEGAKDGWHVTCTDTATLSREPYQWDEPPFAIFRWEDEPFGFYGTGIPAELGGIQLEINTLLRLIQQNMWSGGNLKVFVQKGSGVAPSHISNDLRAPIIEYEGNAPVFHANDVVSPQVMNHLRYLVESAYNVTGISQLQAQSQTPFASMSGRARLVHQNSESLRFKTQTERYEEFFKDLARRTLEAATDLAESGHGAEVVIFKDQDHLEQVKLSDVVGDPENFEIQAWSSSQLPQTVAGRLSIVEQLLKDGMVDQRRALQLLDLPDLHGEMDVANAPYNLCEMHIARIIYDGEYLPPSPALNLEYALSRVKLEIARAELRRGVPQERIDMLRDWEDTVVSMFEQMNEPAVAPAPAGAAPMDAALPPDMAPPPGGPAPLPSLSPLAGQAFNAAA